MVRTSVAASELTPEEAVRTNKQLPVVERAFRSIKTVDLKVRPIYHYRSEVIQCHIFLCMLAYYAAWHMQKRLAPMPFAEEDAAAAKAARKSVVAPAVPSPATRKKARTRKTSDGTPALSFRALMEHLACLSQDHLQERTATARHALYSLPSPRRYRRRH